MGGVYRRNAGMLDVSESGNQDPGEPDDGAAGRAEGGTMNNHAAIRLIYRAYMREERLNVYTLAKRLNNAWRARGQKPRMNWRLFASL